MSSIRNILMLVGFFIFSLGAIQAQDTEELKKVEKEIREEQAAKADKGGMLSKLAGKLKKDPSEEKKEKALKPTKLEKQADKDYKKSLKTDRPMFEDKYGRPTNAGPRFESDAKIKKINRKHQKKVDPKPTRKERKPSRSRYRYD